ncbi:hypothetical protein QFZ79_004113 [Arthrobacter sp. V4I6]|uniref:hypothetical protein n=1 Tax=unclassified Arthrobacter TaxID=235627 RepID=UPI00278A56C4|nr:MULTISPECIES: hypothetical protein [unclassified Arthrobacter]MDQ0821738.1 hypothetical protein [Arthrobacter sp. V1I7]MDQ0856002.1 hypothetical protein [Arthrobacter sp. V4I6]
MDAIASKENSTTGYPAGTASTDRHTDHGHISNKACASGAGATAQAPNGTSDEQQ